jgi:hypothetical protein
MDSDTICFVGGLCAWIVTIRRCCDEKSFLIYPFSDKVSYFTIFLTIGYVRCSCSVFV